MFRPRAAAAALLMLTSAAAAQSGDTSGPALRSTIDRAATPATVPPNAGPAANSAANAQPLSLQPAQHGPRHRLRGAPVVAGNKDIFVDEYGQLTTSYQP